MHQMLLTSADWPSQNQYLKWGKKKKKLLLHNLYKPSTMQKQKNSLTIVNEYCTCALWEALNVCVWDDECILNRINQTCLSRSCYDTHCWLTIISPLSYEGCNLLQLLICISVGKKKKGFSCKIPNIGCLLIITVTFYI